MKIIIATDGSDVSISAVKKICQTITTPENTQIKIISVYKAVVPLDTYGASMQYSQKMEDALRSQAEAFF